MTFVYSARNIPRAVIHLGISTYLPRQLDGAMVHKANDTLKQILISYDPVKVRFLGASSWAGGQLALFQLDDPSSSLR